MLDFVSFLDWVAALPAFFFGFEGGGLPYLSNKNREIKKITHTFQNVHTKVNKKSQIDLESYEHKPKS